MDILVSLDETMEPMSKRKNQEDKLGDQFKRFVDTARELGCEEDEAAFDKALGKVASSPPPKSIEKRKSKSTKKRKTD